MKNLNKLKYDKVNVIAKCNLTETYNVDMNYNATYSDRVNKETGILQRFYNFFFNPKPFGNEGRYFELLNKVVNKNLHMKNFKIKSVEVNFDYQTDLEFNQLDLLSKVLADTLSKLKYKKVNINADIQGFNYKEDNFQDRTQSYKFFKKKSKNKLLEVKLYAKYEGVNRFEIIFHNTENKLFKTLEDSSISKGKRIKKEFESIYSKMLEILEENKDLYHNDGIAEFINAFVLTLSESDKEQAA